MGALLPWQPDTDYFISAHIEAAGRDRPSHEPVDVRRVEGTAVSALIFEYARDTAVAGEWFADDVHYFDMVLSDMRHGSRPAGTRGCFPEAFSDFQNVGKVLYAPPGRRFSGWGGSGRQRTLSVFLHKQSGCAEEPELAGDPERVLRQCVSLPSEPVQRLLTEISRELYRPGFASTLMIEGLALTAQACAMRTLRGVAPAAKGGLPPWRLQLIEERLRDGEGMPTIFELAELCRLSRRQLMRAFRQETGETIGAFVQRVAIERAKALLRSTENPIRLVALECGFTNASAFATAFRRAVGASPRDFRNTRGTRPIA